MRSTRADTSRTARIPTNPRNRNQFGCAVRRPGVIPEALRRPQPDVLHGRVRRRPRRGDHEPVRDRADGADAAGELLRGHDADPEPVHGPAVSRQHHPAVAAVADGAEAPASTTRRRTWPGTANNLQGPSPNTDNVDQFLTRVDQNLGNKVRLNAPLQLARQLQQQRLQRRDPGDRGDAAARQQQQLVRLHPHAEAEPAQRFPDRLPPRRLRHAEPLRGRTVRRTPAPSLGIPGFDGDVRYSNPGHPEHQHQQLHRARRAAARTGTSSTRRSRCRTCSRTRAGAHNLRAGFDLRRLATGRRAANDPRGLLRLHRRHHRLRGGRLHARPAAHGDSADRSDPGPRRRLAQRLLRQRRLAGVAEPHAQPGPALRAEHAGADLRGTGVDARRGFRDDHPGDASRRRASSSTSRTTRTSRRGSAPPIASARRPCCAPGSGSTTTRTR